jgi:hypothetical protein
MKVFWAGMFEGDYGRSLQKGLASAGVNITNAYSDFLKKKIPPGYVIHVHWLEAYGTSKAMLKALSEGLSFYKGRNPLIWTAHNLQPHDISLKEGRHFYQALIPFFDATFHLGPVSIERLTAVYKLPPSQRQLLCPHHILPAKEDSNTSTPWKGAQGVWISLGRLRSRGDKIKLETYVDEALANGKTIYIHRYPHLIQRKIYKRRYWDARLLWQEAKWRWLNSQVHLNFGPLAEKNVVAWIKGAERLLLPRTTHLNSGIPFLAAPFGIPIQVPPIGNIPWQLEQLGYEKQERELYRAVNSPNWEKYQLETCMKWQEAYRTLSDHT